MSVDHALPPLPTGAAPGVKLPPVTEIGMTSLALIVIGGIYLAAHLPEAVPLGPAVGLLAARRCFVVNLGLFARVAGFRLVRFFQVAKWALCAYAITAGLILFAFVRDHLTGAPLAVLSLSLVVYAVHVPILIAFTVARYEAPGEAQPS